MDSVRKIWGITGGAKVTGPVNPSLSSETFSCHSRSFVAFLEMWNFTPIKKLMSNNDDTGNEMATMAYRWVANSEDQMAKCFTNERNTNERIPNPPKGDAIVS